MQFIATVKLGSELDTIYRNSCRIDMIFGQNIFKLSNGVFICDDIRDLNILKRDPDVEITAASILPKEKPKKIKKKRLVRSKQRNRTKY